MIKSLYLPFYVGLGGPVLPGNQPLPWIHKTDICNLIEFCIEKDQAKDVINGVAPQIVTNREFSKVRIMPYSILMPLSCTLIYSMYVLHNEA